MSNDRAVAPMITSPSKSACPTEPSCVRIVLTREFVEEHVECGLGPAGSSPDKTAGVMVIHNDPVTAPAFVGDLIDPDPTQTPKTVDVGFDIVVDTGDD